MENREKIAEVLNDLIRINNDRTEGYNKAAEHLNAEDTDLRNTYLQMARQSEGLAARLRQEVRTLGEAPSEGTTGKGKIYRAWMSVRDTFTYDDRQTTLNECEYGEDAAQKAYKEALAADVVMNTSLRDLISQQKAELKESHDLIKRTRDAEKVHS